MNYYGRLKYARLCEKEAANVVEELIDDVLGDENSGINLPEKPESLEETIEFRTSIEEGEYYVRKRKAKSLAMNRVKVELEKGIKAVEQKSEEVCLWIQDLKRQTILAVDTRMHTAAAERFTKDIRKVFTDAEAREKAIAIKGAGVSGGSGPTTTET